MVFSNFLIFSLRYNKSKYDTVVTYYGYDFIEQRKIDWLVYELYELSEEEIAAEEE